MGAQSPDFVNSGLNCFKLFIYQRKNCIPSAILFVIFNLLKKFCLKFSIHDDFFLTFFLILPKNKETAAVSYEAEVLVLHASFIEPFRKLPHGAMKIIGRGKNRPNSSIFLKISSESLQTNS